MDKKKRNLKTIRNYVLEQVARDDQRMSARDGRIRPQSMSSEGQQISGTDLQAASSAIAKIPDAADRKVVEGMFSGVTKYQALAMLLEPAGKWFKAYPQQVEEIARQATETDVSAELSTRIGRCP